ncbi:MAG TPA: ATP-binding protein [Thermoleophilia bacterium]|nr:ATP-binding protein [Thermoleophilia bacterium]
MGFLLRSVRNWLTVLFLVVVAVAVATAYLYIVPPLQDRLVTQKLNELTTGAQSLLSQRVPLPIDSSGRVLPGFDQTLQNYAVFFDGRINARVVFVNANTGYPLGDSRRTQPFNVESFPVIEHAVEADRFQAGTTLINGTEYAAVASPISYQWGQTKRLGAVLLITTSLRDVQAAVQIVKRQLLLATGLGLLVAGLTGYLAAYLIARRLKRIERSAEAIAAGDLAATVRVRTPDEVGQLGITFNKMGLKLREAFSQIEREKEQIEILLTDLSEGVIGVSADGQVLIANPSSAQLLARHVPGGAALEDVLPDDALQVWRESRESGQDETTVFDSGERILEATAYPATGEPDVDSIVLLRDVTSQVKLERARREFVANASHELKTPLFSLSGFMELLDEGDLDPATHREFLTLMREQVDRLTDLSLSLLDLSQMDSGEVPVHPASVDLGETVGSVLSEFQPRLADKELTATVESADAATVAWCDEQRLTQVLRALLDNAVKFSPRGGRITIALGEEGARASLAVSDEGPGIPPGEVERVFDRFYRGSANRGQSGTGLGLSIARELVQLMGGTIAASQGNGSGATFSLKLPLQPPEEAASRRRRPD